MYRLFKILFFLLFWGISSTHISFGQTSAIQTFLKSPGLKHAGISIQVTDLETGKTICSHNPEMALIPASCLKLITTATAMELLGSQYRYTTRLYTNGTIDSQGILKGNLYIQGSGDPTLGSEYSGTDKNAVFKTWTSTLQQKGIRSISGSIIVLDDLYGYEGVAPKWNWEDMGNYYASGTSGISIFDNTFRLHLRSGAKGTRPEIIRTNPEMTGLRFENHLTSAANTLDSAYIYGMPYSLDRRLYGTIPQNKNDFIIKGDIPDPGLFLSEYFTASLKQQGISITGKPLTSRFLEEKPELKTELTITRSPEMGKIIREINVRSNNHYAEHVLYTIGTEYLLKNKLQQNDYPARSSGILAIQKHWQGKGIDMSGLSMHDGCGLSPSNAVPASLLVSLLIHMKTNSPQASIFFTSLPETGKEGTVRNFLQQPAVKGSRVKSGSISGVQSYAGYLQKGGKQYAFAIIINHFSGSRASLRKNIENLLLNF